MYRIYPYRSLKGQWIFRVMDDQPGNRPTLTFVSGGEYPGLWWDCEVGMVRVAGPGFKPGRAYQRAVAKFREMLFTYAGVTPNSNFELAEAVEDSAKSLLLREALWVGACRDAEVLS